MAGSKAACRKTWCWSWELFQLDPKAIGSELSHSAWIQHLWTCLHNDTPLPTNPHLLTVLLPLGSIFFQNTTELFLGIIYFSKETLLSRLTPELYIFHSKTRNYPLIWTVNVILSACNSVVVNVQLESWRGLDQVFKDYHLLLCIAYLLRELKISDSKICGFSMLLYSLEQKSCKSIHKSLI